MANTKISALTADAAPTADDLVVTVNDPGGTPATRKATITNFTKAIPAVIGDSGSGGTKGLVPAPAAGDAAANKFLHADGTFKTPTGSGSIGGTTGSTDNAILRADGTGGSTLQSSALSVDDNGAVTVPEIAAPSTPAAGKVVLYAKSDGLLYSKDDAGTETVVTGGGGGGGVPASSTNILPYSDGSAFQNSPLVRADANTIDHFNGTGETATRHNWYTNRTDASNYDRLSIYYDTGSDHFVIDSNKAGTGTIRRLNVAMGGSIFWIFRTDGQLRANSNTGSTITSGEGTSASPGYQLGTSGSSKGWFLSGGNWAYSDSNSHSISLANGVYLKSNGGFYFSSSSTPDGANDAAIKRDGTNRLIIDNASGSPADLKVRQHYVDQTITAGGTTGNQTIDKAAGTVNIAAGNSAVTVTNNLVSTSSLVFAVIRTNDATATIKNVVPASGSFVINLTAAATAEISIGFLVINK